MDVEIKKLKQLVTVARTRSFSRAAAELHITQPALSRSIAAFEEYFGIKIFDRGRRGASLTPLGAIAVAEAERLLQNARALDHNLHLYSTGDAGRICFGMGPLVASMILPRLSTHFLHNRPNLQLQASIKTASVLMSELMDDRIEMLFYSGDYLELSGDLTRTRVGTIELSAIVRAGHPLANRENISRAEMKKFPMLCSSEFGLNAQWAGNGMFLCDNYHILKETVLHTDGIWISSPQFVAEEIHAGQLATAGIAALSPPRNSEICVLRRNGYTATPASIAICEFVCDILSGDSAPE